MDGKITIIADSLFVTFIVHDNTLLISPNNTVGGVWWLIRNLQLATCWDAILAFLYFSLYEQRL